MAYVSKGGFTYPIEEMDSADREWFAERLNKQLKLEEKAIRNSGKGKRR